VRLSRFALVGALCALLSNMAVIALAHHGFGSLVASVLAFGPVLLAGYALHSMFTFGAPPARTSFVRYTLAMLANFPLWAAAFYVFGDVLKVPVTVVAPATTLLIFLWNYVAARWAFLPQAFERRLP
jgi:putative flippase GtrA